LTYAQKPCGGARKSASDPQHGRAGHGSRKLLILMGFVFCQFCGHPSESLDFSSFAVGSGVAINKVIHRNSGWVTKGFEFKDLSATSVNRLRMSR
jgi:hypothetical protein